MKQWLEARGRVIQPLQRGFLKQKTAPTDAEESDDAMGSAVGEEEASDDAVSSTGMEDDVARPETESDVDVAGAALEQYEKWRDEAAQLDAQAMLDAWGEETFGKGGRQKGKHSSS